MRGAAKLGELCCERGVLKYDERTIMILPPGQPCSSKFCLYVKRLLERGEIAFLVPLMLLL